MQRLLTPILACRSPAQVFLFRFVNCFLSLYYYAFNKQHGILQLSVQVSGGPCSIPRRHVPSHVPS